VQAEKAEAIIKEMDSRFRSRPGFRLIIFEVQATIPQPEPDEPPPPAEPASVVAAPSGPVEEEPKDPQRIACVELVEQLSGSVVANRIFVATLVLSTVVAAIGLIRGNVAVVIGAMVIAPLLGPNMALALATTLGDSKLARNSLRVNGLGMLVALLLAVLIGFVVAPNPAAPEIHSRTTVQLSDVALALAAGSAGALALTTGLSAAVMGVMVAVALLPPLVTTGLLAGSGHWSLAWGSLLLTATNVICINLAGVATFLWQGIRPSHWWETARARRMVRIAAVIWLGLLVLLIVIIRFGPR
jgi:uncharacterized hydrophobic protein (TIGR00341 family)